MPAGSSTPSTGGWEPSAVLFDLDGTLVDSMPVWQRAYPAVAAAHGRALQPDWWRAVAGRGLTESVAVVAPDADPIRTMAIAHELVAAAVELVEAEGIAPMPGAGALVAAAGADDRAVGVVTGSWRRFAEAALDHLGVRPAVLVTGDEGHPAKPDPAGYLHACQVLGVDPPEVLVVEDTPSGVEAARAAGCRVLAAPSGAPIDSAGWVRIVPALTVAAPEQLLRWDAAETGAEHGRPTRR